MMRRISTVIDENSFGRGGQCESKFVVDEGTINEYILTRYYIG